MPGPAEGADPKLIVIPRPLEGFFFEKLSERFADRVDVRVVVDRRVGERRQPRWVAGNGPFSERRRSDRRARDVKWSLPDLPVALS